MRIASIVTLFVFSGSGCGSSSDRASDPTERRLATGVGIPLPLTPSTLDRQEIHLPNHLVGHRSRVKRNGWDFTWFGTVGQHGRAVITSRNGRMYGTVIDGKQAFELVIVNGTPRLVPVDHKKLKPAHRKGDTFRHGQKLVEITEDGPIGVIAAYTTACETKYSDIEARIENAIQLTNEVSMNTHLDTRFELLHRYKAPTFDESTEGLEMTLEMFATDNKAFRDKGGNGIFALREKYGADIAILVEVTGTNDASGITRLTPAQPDSTFSLVDCYTMTVGYTMAHEIGHILGLNDDTDTSDITYPDGYGFTDAIHEFRTVMTESSICNDCMLVPFWSNPDANWNGHHAGAPTIYNSASVIRKTAGRISRYFDKP